MNGVTRRFAAILGALTLTVTLVFAGLLYHEGTIPDPTRSGIVEVGTTQDVGSDSAQDDIELVEGAELIDDEANPLAAPDTPDASVGATRFPVHLVLGFGLGFVVVFFISHIVRVNASISDMNRKTR